MKTEAFDLLVIGGGIVGAGIARDAALRGLKTALVERGDFASGTSSKTSRLVHGGLRYLKNFKVGLVRQAVRERDLLLEQAPALVIPLAFTIPTYEGRGTGRITLRFGLWVYDFLSRDKVLPRRGWLGARGVKGREPRLNGRPFSGGAVYHDALTNDARLVLAVIRAAADAGAVVANYAEVTELQRAGGRIGGAKVHDRIGNSHFDIHAAVFVNATGVWLDRLRSTGIADRTVRPTKGIHVFLPRNKVGNREAVVLSAKRDGRMLFVLPWGSLSLVGTTDTDFTGDPDHVVPEVDDVAYLLESVNDAFPDAHVGPEDVVSTYAGLRPLIEEGKPREESDISREHELFEDPDGLISVAGGKLTTHRAMAEAVVDRVAKRIGRGTPCRTSVTALGPTSAAVTGFLRMGFDQAMASFLASRHAVDDLGPWAREESSTARILPELPYLWIEVASAVEAEMAMTLEDVMVRRLGLFYESTDQGLSVVETMAERIGAHLGWDETRRKSEVEAYHALVADHRRYLVSHDH
jgi:glycerol-3-phosphate dehydrogenase